MKLHQSQDLQLQLTFGDGQVDEDVAEAIPFTSSTNFTKTSFQDVRPITFEGSTHRANLQDSNYSTTTVDNILGRSAALDELASKSRAESIKKSTPSSFSWDDDIHRLANSIRTHRTSVQRALQERSLSDEVERHNQSIKIQKIRTYRNKIARGSWVRKWARKAEDEIRALQTVEIELEEESRRDKAKVIRESERVAASLAPNGLNLRGKSQRGPFLGYGPLPGSLSRGKGPNGKPIDTGSWDKSGRKFETTTSSQIFVDPSIKSGSMIIRSAAANVSLYKLDLKAIFYSVCKSEEGLINLRGLVAIFAKIGIQLGPDELAPVAKCFGFRDDGMLSYEDFCWEFFDRRSFVRQWSRTFSRLSEEEAMMKLQLTDSLGDGRLNPKGLARLLNIFGLKLSEEMLMLVFQRFATKDAKYMDLKTFLLYIETELQSMGETQAQYVAMYQEAQLSRLLRERSTLQRKASMMQSNSPSRTATL